MSVQLFIFFVESFVHLLSETMEIIKSVVSGFYPFGAVVILNSFGGQKTVGDQATEPLVQSSRRSEMCLLDNLSD